MVCDQPYLSAAHLYNLAEQYEKLKVTIVASGYNNTVGVPALFDWSVHETLLQIPDQGGAKQVLVDSCQTSVAFEAGEMDLDTMADYATLQSIIKE